ncbi:MAG: hypothetical protein Q9181_007694 [Wetmoreana brouardii]
MFFDSKKPSWSDPEKSTGRPCNLKFRGTECWEVTGPALDVFNKVAPAIAKLLADNQELLEQGEAKPRVVMFNMWMEGSKPSSSQPVVVFSSKSRRQRSYAKALLKQSGILAEYPGISIKALDKMPAVHQAKALDANRDPTTQSELDVFMTDPLAEPFGAQISFGDSKIATMLGIVMLNGKPHALIPQHPRFDYNDEDLDTPPLKDHLLEFDEDSETGDDDLAETTSKASASSSLPSDTGNTSPQTVDDIIFDAPHTNAPNTTPSTLATSALSSSRSSNRGSVAFSEAEWAESHFPFGHRSKRVKIVTLSPNDPVNDLDYECHPIKEFTYHQQTNRILLPRTVNENRKYLFPQKIAAKPDQSTVWAVTGTTGLVKGTILENPYYIKMNGSSTCQEMWPVRLERDTIPGDCGAWVVNATTGDIYGHIVAGDPVSGLAYIIPAFKVFDDIERCLGARPSLLSDAFNVQLVDDDVTAFPAQLNDPEAEPACHPLRHQPIVHFDRLYPSSRSPDFLYKPHHSFDTVVRKPSWEHTPISSMGQKTYQESNRPENSTYGSEIWHDWPDGSGDSTYSSAHSSIETTDSQDPSISCRSLITPPVYQPPTSDHSINHSDNKSE